MSKFKFTDIIYFSGKSPSFFMGTKKYISTGNVDIDTICFDDVVDVSYENRPSRANVTCPVGSVIFAKMAGTQKTLLIDEEKSNYIYSTGFFCVSPQNDKITSKCLYYLTNSPSFNMQKDKYSCGSTQVAINNDGLSKILVDIPNLDEQAEATKILDELTSLKSKILHCIKTLDELTKSVFEDFFGDLNRNDRHWPMAKLSDVSQYYNGLTYSPNDINSSGTIVLRSGNIQNGELNFADIIKVDRKIGKKYFVSDGDILMCSRNGSPRLVGKTAVIRELSEPMCFGAFMMIIKTKYTTYLKTFFETNYFKEQISQNINTTTINQITKEMLNDVVVPMPTDEMLKKYDAIFDKVEDEKAKLNNLLEKIDTLYNFYLQKYFE